MNVMSVIFYWYQKFMHLYFCYYHDFTGATKLMLNANAFYLKIAPAPSAVILNNIK